MEMKICKKCGLEKPKIEFRLRKDNGRYYNTCKKCQNEIHYNYISKNKEKERERRKKYYKKNKEEILKKMNEYYSKNRDDIRKRRKELYELNKDKIREQGRMRSKKNRKLISKKEKERTKNDYIFKLKKQTRQAIRISFNKKGYMKSERTEKILGCSLEYFINYLLQTYKRNYGYEWDKEETVHIDHIIPLEMAKTEGDIYALCHYTNLQLLKAEDNLLKGSKLNYKIKKESD